MCSLSRFSSGVKDRTIMNLWRRSKTYLWDLGDRGDVGIANRTENLRPFHYMAQGLRLACTAEPPDAHLMPRSHSLLSKRNGERPRSDRPRELPQKYPHELHKRSSRDRHRGLGPLIELESYLSNPPGCDPHNRSQGFTVAPVRMSR